MVRQKVLSPAKVNLMLRILGQRADGYHDLQTIFQILDWGDEMEFVQTSGEGSNQINIEGFPALSNSDNLIYKAAQKIKPFAQNKSNWLIKVDKHIPQGAGLGGGSSNAAQTLKFLNHHWQCGFDVSQLKQIGRVLGADVPIFISEKSALATGIGDQIKGMTFTTPFLLLIFPKVNVSTTEMFSDEKLTRNQTALTLAQMQNQNFWVNDFFPLLLSINSEIKSLYNRISKWALFRLSGTGSTMFAVFQTREEAEKVQRQLPKEVDSKVVIPKVY